MRIDLNCDLGESFGNYMLGMDAEVIPYVSSVNVACGYHAGDPCVMEKTIEMAAAAGVGIGAHPGLLDLMGFGRRIMKISPAEARAYMLYQLGALDAFCRAKGVMLRHVKPHGALYNMAAKDVALAEAVVGAIKDYDASLILLALANSEMTKAAECMGLSYANEVFADRAYEPDGTLVARSKQGAMIEDEEEAIARVIRMVKEGKVTAIDGTEVAIQADSVCVHGDGEKALLFVKKIREALLHEGIEVKGLGER